MALADAIASVTAQYPLGEASGGAIDAVGSLDMTEVNTVGTGTVFGGGARDFEESENDRFTHADNNAFDSGDILFMISAQVVLESKSQAYGTIFGKANSGGDTDYHLNFRGGATDLFEFFWHGTTVRATGFGSPSTATNYLLHAGHDPTANEIWIAVNGTRTATAHASGGSASTRGVAIGDLGEYHDGDSGWDGLIREVIILKGYDFDQDHIDEHYNSGSPVDFADWGGGGIEEGDGSSAGAATVTGVGASIAAALSSSAGVGAANAVGASIAEAVGSSAGVGAATGVSGGVSEADGSSAGVGAATAVGASIAAAIASAAGVAAGSAAGTSLSASSGNAANGVAVASGVGASIAEAVGTCSATSTAPGRSDDDTDTHTRTTTFVGF